MVNIKRLKPTKEFLAIQDYLYAEKRKKQADLPPLATSPDSADYIHTVNQMEIASELIRDISMGEEPAVLADKLDKAVTTVKSFLKRLRDLNVLDTEEIQVDGKTYVAVSPTTRAFLLQPSTNWSDFKSEYKKFKRQNKFKYD